MNETNWAITIWKDGGWKLWSKTDAYYAENDPDWGSTITCDHIQEELKKALIEA